MLNQGFLPAPRSSRTPNHNVECQHSRKTGESERNVLSLPGREREKLRERSAEAENVTALINPSLEEDREQK